jgi:hypothetical protein
MFPQDEDPRKSPSFCPSTNPSAALICHRCEKYNQNKPRRSRSSFLFRSQSQTPPSLYKLPQYTPTIIPGLYQDQQPVLWLVIWNVAGAEAGRQTPERQGGDVSSGVRTSRQFEYSVVVAYIQRKDESRRDYERMFRPPLRPTLSRHRRFLAPTHTKLQRTKPCERSQTSQPYRRRSSLTLSLGCNHMP